jgi:hypothetical protein
MSYNESGGYSSLGGFSSPMGFLPSNQSSYPKISPYYNLLDYSLPKNNLNQVSMTGQPISENKKIFEGAKSPSEYYDLSPEPLPGPIMDTSDMYGGGFGIDSYTSPASPKLAADPSGFTDYFKLPNGTRWAYDRRTRVAIPPGAVGVSLEEYMGLPQNPTSYTSLSSANPDFVALQNLNRPVFDNQITPINPNKNPVADYTPLRSVKDFSGGFTGLLM